MQNKVPALTVGILVLASFGVSLAAQNTGEHTTKMVTLTYKANELVRCAPYIVDPDGTVQTHVLFAQSTPIQVRCGLERGIIAFLKPKPVLKLDKEPMAAMESELDNRVKQVKECFRKHLGMGDSECRAAEFPSQTGSFQDQYGWRWMVTWTKNVKASAPLDLDKKAPYAESDMTYSVSDQGWSATPERVGPISVVSDASGKIITAEKQNLQPGRALKGLVEIEKKGPGS
jgi:hypothetical protein